MNEYSQTLEISSKAQGASPGRILEVFIAKCKLQIAKVKFVVIGGITLAHVTKLGLGNEGFTSTPPA
jgi:hypothetical protein